MGVRTSSFSGSGGTKLDLCASSGSSASRPVNIGLDASVTCVAAALQQFVTIVAEGHEVTAGLDLMLLSSSPSAVSLCLFSGKLIPPSLRKFLRVPGVRQAEDVKELQRLRPHMYWLSFSCCS